ncbi:hypothetical protein EV13_0241 [Prochlorococcus sp. MIT 0702]|nr:hypothetical protein EV12_1852 [Prochlorococcus sp. MIT 0701]KGG30478.1 hypothetical protein EV13_0241 [Prochlorococcus sp. MIT 0702]KGG33985.1 hypothetical protein EV14_1525 [Prochlorococcus sp. MIT 0703]
MKPGGGGKPMITSFHFPAPAQPVSGSEGVISATQSLLSGTPSVFQNLAVVLDQSRSPFR